MLVCFRIKCRCIGFDRVSVAVGIVSFLAVLLACLLCMICDDDDDVNCLATRSNGNDSKRLLVGAVLETDHAKLKTVLSFKPIGL